MQILISLKFQGSYEKMENVLESLKIAVCPGKKEHKGQVQR